MSDSNSENVIVKRCKLEELDEFLEELYEEDIEFVYHSVDIPEDDEFEMEVNGIRIIIPFLNISIREGMYCNYDPDEECFVPDFSITVLYEQEERDPGKYLYWEQDGIGMTLHNYFSGSVVDFNINIYFNAC